MTLAQRLALEHLLVTLHHAGSQLQLEPDPLLRRWGLHLLEDWRSLELIAEKRREPSDAPQD